MTDKKNRTTVHTEYTQPYTSSTHRYRIDVKLTEADQDITAILDEQPNQSQYIRQAIREKAQYRQMEELNRKIDALQSQVAQLTAAMLNLMIANPAPINAASYPQDTAPAYRALRPHEAPKAPIIVEPESEEPDPDAESNALENATNIFLNQFG